MVHALLLALAFPLASCAMKGTDRSADGATGGKDVGRLCRTTGSLPPWGLGICASKSPGGEAPTNRHETVVFIHGLGRTRAAMVALQARFAARGYRTLNFPYTAATESLPDIAKRLRVFVGEQVKTPRYHLVGHSLGNIIIRETFREGFPEGLGRIVMLAPPNQPAKLASVFGDNPALKPVFTLITGDAGKRLADPAYYATLPVPSVEFGVIAGDIGQSLTFDEPNDCVVPVAGTRLVGMKDFIVLHHLHSFIMYGQDTFERVACFLETGSFGPR